MKLELNELLQEIYSWKNLLKNKDEETENLRRELTFLQKQNETLENSRSGLLYEVAELNKAVTLLRSSFKRIDSFEADKKMLLEEKQKLKNSLTSLEKLHQNEIRCMKKEMQKIEEKNQKNIKELLSKIQNEASRELEDVRTQLVKKENDIGVLEQEISRLLNEREQDMMQLKIQYEDKIAKLKQQKSKTQSSSGLQINDIFRQKYLKVEKESQEKISKLEEKIESLQLLNESLKTKNVSTSLSSMLLPTNKPVSTKDVSVQTDNSFPEISKQLNQTIQNATDFVPIKKTLNKQQCVLPRKRKLFNLSENFY